LAAIREQESVAQIARRFKIHPNVIYKWKRQFLENMSRAFEAEDGGGGDASEREGELLKKIGELTVERDFLSNGLDRSR
jgi:transposase